MDDINRPLRRLEVAQRIQRLRAHALEAAALAQAAHVTEAQAAHVTEAQAPRSAAEAVEPGPEDDDSAASAIATLLRGGQTWILDQG